MMISLLFFLAAPIHAATLEVNGDGKLIGASNVDVGGTLYDVSFVDGTCISLFSGCDDAATDFTFQTAQSAELASQSLIDQVLLGSFDTDPGLTFGCADGGGLCYLTTLYALNENETVAKTAGNLASANIINDRFYSPGFDTSEDGAGVYAVWSQANVSPVPLPAAAWLFLSGLGVLGYTGWRKKAA
jgi:hypothetical protein